MAKQWECDVCGYVHEGDAPPDECPLCGVGPEMFSERMDAAGESEPEPTKQWRCTVCDYVHDGENPPAECPICGVDASLFVAEAEGEEVAPVESAGTTGRRILIVGGGVAAVSAAEAARMQDSDASITLIHKETPLPYNRLNLTRLLAGEVSATDLGLRPDNWYEYNRVTALCGEVTDIDATTRTIELRDGTSHEFDRLIVATGAHAFLPPIPGVSRDGVLPLRTLDNATSMLDRVTEGTRVVCIGGGLLGLEAAGGLARRGARVTVLEGFDWLLPRQLAETGSARLKQNLEQSGIEVRCSVRVKEIAGDEAAHSVVLDDGEEIPVDLVVMATGVRPNSYLARLAGIDADHGILVDDHMQTSAEHVFAAGDVTEHRGVVYGLWPAAVTQGRVAGTNAAGGDSFFDGLPLSTQLKVLNVGLFSIGDFSDRDGASTVSEKDESERYSRVVVRDGRIVGANLYGDISLANTLKKAVEQGTPVQDVPGIDEVLTG